MNLIDLVKKVSIDFFINLYLPYVTSLIKVNYRITPKGNFLITTSLKS